LKHISQEIIWQKCRVKLNLNVETMVVVKISEELQVLAFLHQVLVHHMEEVNAVTSEIHVEEELLDSETHVEHQEDVQVDGMLDVKVALVHHAEILLAAAAIVVQVVMFLTTIMAMETDVRTITA